MAMYKYSLYTQLVERERLSDDEHEDFFVEVHILGMNTRVVGMLSNIPGIKGTARDRHIFMMDTIPLTVMEAENLYQRLENLSKYGNLPIVMIRSSTKADPTIASFHVVIPCVYTVNAIRDLTLESFRKFCDVLFLGLGEKRGFWDLRITSKGRGDGDKPTLIHYWIPDYTLRPISEVHWKIMQTYMPRLPDLHKGLNIIYNTKHIDKTLLRYSVKA